MLLDDLLPSQNTLFKAACYAFQAGTVPPSTSFNSSALQDLKSYVSSSRIWRDLVLELLMSILILFVLLVIVVIIPLIISAVLIRCFPSLKHRKAGLIGSGLAFTATFGFAVSSVLLLQGFGSWYTLLFFIPFVLSIAVDFCSRLDDVFKSQGYLLTNIIIASAILTFIGLHVFPQNLFDTCSSESLMVVSAIAIFVMFNLTFAITSFFRFQLILNSEKLYLDYYREGKFQKGYLQKKGSEWVEFLTEQI